jgi:DNA-binding transcriptional ArsR family regulator
MMLTETHLADLSRYCKATADQQRLLILRVLSRESFGVLEICGILDVAQPALSHHLKILATANLVETRRQGTSIYYRRALIHSDDPMKDLRQTLFESVDQIKLSTPISNRIRTTHSTRHEQAKHFFEKNSHLFQENQNLIAEYAHYSDCIENVLDNEPLTRETTAIEIGPGDSDLILSLTRRFKKVIAIDNTDDMLEKTRKKIRQAEKRNVTFLSGELKDNDTSCDLLVLNMVLHHLATPANFFQEARKHLSDSGRLLIADLCGHDQDWTREACGDLWLGFDPDELDTWAANAGFVQGQSVYLGLNNGFQIQVRTYR